MHQRAGRLFRHACITVSGRRDDALKKREHRTHGGRLIEGRNDMHFRRAGIRETYFYATRNKRPDKTLRTVHPGRLATPTCTHVCEFRIGRTAYSTNRGMPSTLEGKLRREKPFTMTNPSQPVLATSAGGEGLQRCCVCELHVQLAGFGIQRPRLELPLIDTPDGNHF